MWCVCPMFWWVVRGGAAVGAASAEVADVGVVGWLEAAGAEAEGIGILGHEGWSTADGAQGPEGLLR